MTPIKDQFFGSQIKWNSIPVFCTILTFLHLRYQYGWLVKSVGYSKFIINIWISSSKIPND